ncbi:MAG: hypothetical protein IME96_06470 [Proteobacteria bacterium]|jgi:hypothetical protein|nr:hypothetical protein [Pseudomonadota bacterium]
MTISTYQVENVLKVYSKQTRLENPIRCKSENLNKYTDIVTLSSEGNKKEAFEKISYSLLDIILQNKEIK